MSKQVEGYLEALKEACRLVAEAKDAFDHCRPQLRAMSEAEMEEFEEQLGPGGDFLHAVLLAEAKLYESFRR